MSTDETKNMLENPAARQGKWCDDAKRYCCLTPSDDEQSDKKTSFCFLGSHIECTRITRLKEVNRAEQKRPEDSEDPVHASQR